MGNHKLRQQLSAKLKAADQGKLYGKGTPNRRRYLPAWKMRIFLAYLDFKPGQKVSDYGANQIIKKVLPLYRNYCRDFHGNRGFYHYNLEQIEYESGYLSCGCDSCLPDPPKTREEIESYHLSDGHIQFMKEWRKPEDRDWKIYNALKEGKHAFDEDGFLLPEYK